MKKVFATLAVAALVVSAVAETHVFWYKATTNAYNLQSAGGPGIPADAIIHEGKIATANKSGGLGYAGSGFSFGNGATSVVGSQGWCGAFFAAQLTDLNPAGTIDSAFLCGEYADWSSGNGPLCNGGAVALRLGVADVATGLVDMWSGDPSQVPDNAMWADLNYMDDIAFAMPLLQEEAVSYTAATGRSDAGLNATAPLLDKQWLRLSVTDQVNWILANKGTYPWTAIVALSDPTDAGEGKSSINSAEDCIGGMLEDQSTRAIPNAYWTADGNSAHIIVYGSGLVAVEGSEAPASDEASIGSNPNPFNPSTTISYNTNNAKASLKVFNAAGKVVFSTSVKGKGSQVWNASSQPSGMYFARLNMGAKSITTKMILMK